MADQSSPKGAEMIGGTEARDIVIVPYDPKWPAVFERHRERIVGALPREAKRVEHIGSTAVPGLAAKPIIDIQVSVANVEDEATYLPSLNATGYLLRVREQDHRMLRTPARDVHVHVCAVRSAWERKHLLFRDWLRTSETDRDLYASAKSALAQQSWPTMDHYANAKSPVIAAIMQRAQAWAATRD